MRPAHMFIYFSWYFDIDQGHSSSRKNVKKENKPRRKVILDNAIVRTASSGALRKRKPVPGSQYAGIVFKKL